MLTYSPGLLGSPGIITGCSVMLGSVGRVSKERREGLFRRPRWCTRLCLTGEGPEEEEEAGEGEDVDGAVEEGEGREA